MKKIVMLGALALLSGGPAAADDCKPLTILTSLPMQTLPGDTVVTIPISFNGVQKQFLLDTGGAYPQISPAIVDQLKLPLHNSNVFFYSANGSEARKFTVLRDFALGPLRTPSLELMVADSGFDGIFVPTIFRNGADFEMDFSAGKLNILSPDHCEGKVIYWKANVVAAVPITIGQYDNHITVPVTIDGHDFKAIIDTGSSVSHISLDSARIAFNLTPESPDMKAVGHLNGEETALLYSHPFKTLTFDGVTVANPRIEIVTDVMNKNIEHSQQTENRALLDSDRMKMPEVIVGMDVLRKLHLYLAMREKRLYLTDASAPAAQTATTTPAAAGQ